MEDNKKKIEKKVEKKPVSTKVESKVDVNENSNLELKVENTKLKMVNLELEAENTKHKKDIETLKFDIERAYNTEQELRNEILSFEREIADIKSSKVSTTTAKSERSNKFSISDTVLYPSKYQSLKFQVLAYYGFLEKLGHVYRIMNHKNGIIEEIIPESYLV